MDEFNYRDFSFCTFHCNKQNHHTIVENLWLFIFYFFKKMYLHLYNSGVN